MSSTEMATCRTCGKRFPSYRQRVPGVRLNTTKWGPARGSCGRCKPNDGGLDWSAARRREAIVPDPDEFLEGAGA